MFEVAGHMLEGGGRKYAGLHAFIDCNSDGLRDWLGAWDRIDTSFEYGGTRYPKELYLYYGTAEGIPEINSGYRIGPTQLGAYTRYLAHGDWNADGYVDIACRIDLFNDTSFNNRSRLIGRPVVFWGNANGEYSIADTTVLSTGAAMDLGLSDGGVWDYNADGIDDLIIRAGTAVNEQGEIVVVPGLQIFRGRSTEEWRDTSASRLADIVWWNPPPGGLSKRLMDIDCDNYPDLIISREEQNGGTLAVFYGSDDVAVHDTNSVENLSLGNYDVQSVKLIDVTKDNVLDLVVLAARFASQRIMVWPGEPGKRVSEIVWATNGDTLVLREPWVSIPTTNALHDGWGDLGFQLHDLGDANLDGYNDIWAFTTPFFVCYSTGLFLDSLIDGIYRMDGTLPLDLVNLGDIDGTGVPTVAMGYVSTASRGITFFKPTAAIPFTGKFRPLPHPRDVQRCFSTVSVASDELTVASERSLGVHVIPNPASGQVTVTWRRGDTETRRHGEAAITVHDALGQEVATFRAAAGSGAVVWDASGVPDGRYFVTVTTNNLSEIIGVVVL